MRTQQLKKGVGISFNFNEDETRIIARDLKKTAENKKRVVAQKKHQKILDDFFAAVKNEDIKELEQSIDKIRDVNILNGRITPLYYAAKNGAVESIRLLIKNGADVNKRSGSKNEYPLMVVVKYNRQDAARLLAAEKADLSVKNSGGYTLLHIAADNNNPALIKFLTGKGLDINALATGNITSEACKIEQVKALIESGADKNIKDVMGSTALDKAAAANHQKIADYLKSLDKNR